MFRFLGITIFFSSFFFFAPELNVKYVLIREIDFGEYNNSRPLSEIILLLNNGKAVFLRDSIENFDLNTERKNKIKSILSLGSFEKIDNSKMVKRTTDYVINKDSLKIYFLPENDKSSYFNGSFKATSKNYNSSLYVKMGDKIHRALEITEDKVKIYEFRVYSYN